MIQRGLYTDSQILGWCHYFGGFFSLLLLTVLVLYGSFCYEFKFAEIKNSISRYLENCLFVLRPGIYTFTRLETFVFCSAYENIIRNSKQTISQFKLFFGVKYAAIYILFLLISHRNKVIFCQLKKYPSQNV